ncbi:hypothetical protein N7462_001810 [Penicillium macrosclerotiorum]|uniref:uncharacterized protein n=1 Tax=Penicillium macrosclerotiorum TaxID=303699 RepID=UPI002547DD03|nr:uncharacterized protein N7462_001810 [Penicillium macrosclerotiorum]KAJ5692387.1 hypothetical protein N7462_001810 [Penicillium macrosclerotiorum]
MPTNLSILVFIASPLDYARYRHTALYFEFGKPDEKPDDTATPTGVPGQVAPLSIKSSVMEVVGSPGFFSFSERVNADLPGPATGLAQAIRVSSIPDTVPVPALRATASGTPIPEATGDWNSQNWVGDVLERFVNAGYLDGEARDRGLDEMVDVVMEAKDEEIIRFGSMG